MSDAVSNSENIEDVEDVLSSIKRLVSVNGKPRPEDEGVQKSKVSDTNDDQTEANADDEGKKTGALLLTSALRVPTQPQEPVSTLESLRESVNETIASEAETTSEHTDQTHDMTAFSETSSLHWIAPSPVSDYYEDEAAEEDGPVSRLPPEVLKAASLSQDSDGAPRASAEVLRLVPIVSKSEANEAADTPAEAAQVDESVEIDASGEAGDVDPIVRAEALEEEPPVVSEEKAPEFSADADLDPSDDEASQVETMDAGLEYENAFDDDWNLEDLASDATRAAEGHDDDWGAHAASQPYVAAAESAAEPWDDVVAAGSAPFSRDHEEPEVVGIATFVRSGREVTYREVEDLEDEDLNMIPDAETIEEDPIEAEAEEYTSGVFEDDVIDEEALRELVAEIVREELTGALGQRITRSVRKLVRQEINRALAAQELD